MPATILELGNKMKHRTLMFGVLLTMAGTNAALADETEFQWSTGLDYSQGKYTDTQTTKILYAPFNATMLFGDFTAKATVPYIRITGPGTVVGGGGVGPIARNNPSGTITTESGIGDIVAALSYTKMAQNNTLFIDFTGKVKLPTASSTKNLGTGLTDYTAQIDLTKAAGPVNLFGTIGYRWMGSSPTFVLQNGFISSVGFSTDISANTNVGLIYDYREAASLTAQNPSEITGFIGWKLSKQVRLQTYGVVGFSNGSPDTGVGMQISFRR